MITALEVYRSLPRYLAARTVGGRLPALATGPLAPLRLVSREEPRPPAEGWARVRPRLSGICGSDLATLSGGASLYFSALVSMPFVPGHEVVGQLVDDCGDLTAGTRVVLDPLLTCATRGLPPCAACADGARNRCDRITGGHLAPGLQTGYCADTGGGWGGVLVAHRSQLHPVPDGLPDERAVLVEPVACAVHTALQARVGARDMVLVVGAGTVGLLTVLALRELTEAGPVVAVAKHAAQAELARRFGATDVLRPDEVVAGVRRATRALRLAPERGPDFLLGGVDVAVDAAGTTGSLQTALRSTKAGGRVVLAAMPAPGVDLAPAWYRELEVVGAYGSGAGGFDLAMQVVADAAVGDLVGASYPLDRWREALEHAQTAGRLGTVKVAFDLRPEKRSA